MGYATPPPNYQQSNSDTQVFIILGFIFAGLGLVPCCGFVFGFVGLILGIIALTKGNQLGVWVIVASVVAGILGFAIWMALGNHFAHTMKGMPFPPNMPNMPKQNGL